VKNLIKILNNRKLINMRQRLVHDVFLSDETEKVLHSMEEYMEVYNTVIDDWDTFFLWFTTVKYPGLSGAKVKIYKALFEAVRDSDDPVSTGHDSSIAKDIVGSILKKTYAEAMASKLFDVAHGSDDTDINEAIEDSLSEYSELRESYGLLIDADEERDEDNNVMSVLDDDTSKQSSGFNWCLKELDMTFGKLCAGDLYFIGGRPDSGKTSLLCHQVAHTLKQIGDGRSIVWMTNEERASKVKLRLLSSISKMSATDIMSDVDDFKSKHSHILPEKDALIVKNIYDWNTKSVSSLLNKINPALIIFDQLSKISITQSCANDAERLSKLASFARSLSQNYPVLSTIWADGSAEGAQYIQQGQLYGSKTGIQGEADAILTVGRLHNDSIPNARYLYAPKNKLSGGDPSCRNAKWEVVIHPEIGRYSSVNTPL